MYERCVCGTLLRELCVVDARSQDVAFLRDFTAPVSAGWNRMCPVPLPSKPNDTDGNIKVPQPTQRDFLPLPENYVLIKWLQEMHPL